MIDLYCINTSCLTHNKIVIHQTFQLPSSVANWETCWAVYTAYYNEKTEYSQLAGKRNRYDSNKHN